MESISLSWIKNKDCSHHQEIRLNIDSKQERSFKEDVRIEDLVDLIWTNGDNTTRGLRFVAGFKLKRFDDYVMLISHYDISSEQDIEDKNAEHLGISDIVYYRVLQRKAFENFE